MPSDDTEAIREHIRRKAEEWCSTIDAQYWAAPQQTPLPRPPQPDPNRMTARQRAAFLQMLMDAYNLLVEEATK